ILLWIDYLAMWRGFFDTFYHDCGLLTLLLYFSFNWFLAHRDLHSFPTRRSSDLIRGLLRAPGARQHHRVVDLAADVLGQNDYAIDRKSTRLNSSHDQISYAVFCLKKKK